MIPKRLQPRIVQKEKIKKKDGRRGGAHFQWPWWVVLLILEMLSHRTPPTCVAANVLTVVKILFPMSDVVKKLWTTHFVRDCRSVLVFFTKTLAAYNLARLARFDQLFSDGTDRRQIKIENAVVGYLSDRGFRTITLACDIIAERPTAIGVKDAVMSAFKQGRALLTE